ncbi:type IV secretion system protein [Candidatus Bartonella washoeensis]
MMVFDTKAASNMAEQIRQSTQQLQQLQKRVQQGYDQINQLKSQLDQMKQLYSSLNVKPDISALQEMFNKQESNGTLPSDFNQLQQSIDGTSSGGGGKNTEK